VTKTWLVSTRAVMASGLLFLGAEGSALADHQPSIDIEVATHGVYTRFATGPRHGYYPYYAPGGYYAYVPPPVPVYVPGYWTWQPPPGHWHDGGRHRHEGRGHGHRKHRHHD
jgi:hypothetical protein